MVAYTYQRGFPTRIFGQGLFGFGITVFILGVISHCYYSYTNIVILDLCNMARLTLGYAIAISVMC